MFGRKRYESERIERWRRSYAALFADSRNPDTPDPDLIALGDAREERLRQEGKRRALEVES